MKETIVRYEDKGRFHIMHEEVGELVRCKDCKHWYRDADVGDACEFTNLWQPPNGYCNWGERDVRNQEQTER